VELTAALDLIVLAVMLYMQARQGSARREEIAILVRQQQLLAQRMERTLERTLDGVKTTVGVAKAYSESAICTAQDAKALASYARDRADEASARPGVVLVVGEPANDGRPPRRPT
jgi:hypothetical protein